MKFLKSKRPLVSREGRNVQRRKLEIKIVFEFIYFITCYEINARFYGKSPLNLLSKLGAYALISKF